MRNDEFLGIGGLGIGDWAQSPIPNPQSPIPNPQSPLNVVDFIKFYYIKIQYYKLFLFFIKKSLI